MLDPKSQYKFLYFHKHLYLVIPSDHMVFFTAANEWPLQIIEQSTQSRSIKTAFNF